MDADGHMKPEEDMVVPCDSEVEESEADVSDFLTKPDLVLISPVQSVISIPLVSSKPPSEVQVKEDTEVPCTSNIEQSEADAKVSEFPMRPFLVLISLVQYVVSNPSISMKPPSRATTSRRFSPDPIDDVPFSSMENLIAFPDEAEGAPLPLPKPFYSDVLPAPTDWEYPTVSLASHVFSVSGLTLLHSPGEM